MSNVTLTFGQKLKLSMSLVTMGFILLFLGNKYLNTFTHNVLEDVVEKSIPSLQSIVLIDMIHDGTKSIGADLYYAGGSLSVKDREGIIADLKGNKEDVETHFSRVEEIIKDNKDMMEKYNQSKVLMNEYLELAIQFAGSDNPTELARQEFWSNFLEKFELLVINLEALNEAATNFENEQIQNNLKTVNHYELLILIFSIIIIASYLIYTAIQNRNWNKMFSELTRNLAATAEKLSQVMEGVNQSAGSVVSAASQQQAAIQSSSTALEQVSAMVGRTSDRAKEVNGHTKNSLEYSIEGKNGIQKLLTTINELKSANQFSAKQLTESNQKVAEIVNIIEEISVKTKVINDIVFQTKLLSFNASVEAARAGEHGKGFAVVAEEVGNLAQMSGKAALEINELLQTRMQGVSQVLDENKKLVQNMLKDSGAMIAKTVDEADHCFKSLESIASTAEKVASMIRDISEGSSESAKGVSDINRSIHEIESAGRITSEASRSSFKAAKDLENEMSILKENATNLSYVIFAEATKKVAA